ncbi:hypothetical protein Pse7367_0417 [Thalassoporum mexicanum PCC 7367]|nr:hypothetical protein Pse7367_0417 [Pseudanabaena sp. PCC 7367]
MMWEQLKVQKVGNSKFNKISILILYPIVKLAKTVAYFSPDQGNMHNPIVGKVRSSLTLILIFLNFQFLVQVFDK